MVETRDRWSMITARVERWEQLAELLYGRDPSDRSCELQRETADLGKVLGEKVFLHCLPTSDLTQCFPLAK